MSNPRPGTVRRNTLINLAGAALPAVLSLAVVPAFLAAVGPVRYGVLAIVWTLLGYFSILDLGFGQATSNRVATLKDAPKEQVRRVFWTALTLNAAIGLLGSWILLLVGNVLLGSVFKIPSAIRPEALGSVPWLALGVPLVTTATVLGGTLEGEERFGTLNILGVSGTLVMQIAPLLWAWGHGPALSGLVAVTIVTRAVGNVLMLAACFGVVGLAAPSLDRGQIGGLFRFGGWVSISAVMNAVLQSADRFVIGIVSGMAAVTNYTIPFNLVNRLIVLPASLGRTLFPRFAKISPESAEALLAEATTAVAVVMTPVAITGLLVVREFLRLWVGPAQAAASAPVADIIFLGLWMNGLAHVPSFYHLGRGRPDVPAKFHLVEAIPFVIALVIGTRFWGITGAALAWTLRVSADALLLYQAARLPLQRQARFLPAVGLLLAAFGLAIHPLAILLEIGVGAVLLALALAWGWKEAPPPLRVLFDRRARSPGRPDEKGAVP